MSLAQLEPHLILEREQMAARPTIQVQAGPKMPEVAVTIGVILLSCTKVEGLATAPSYWIPGVPRQATLIRHIRRKNACFKTGSGWKL